MDYAEQLMRSSAHFLIVNTFDPEEQIYDLNIDFLLRSIMRYSMISVPGGSRRFGWTFYSQEVFSVTIPQSDSMDFK
ncbi:MAG: hypothetical protein LBS60_09190 [Deltaproteobacteria bacterium]|jgi:hypothetical protein|nr:hypothetical protein [Deltaproteobacteria bacterium]